MVLDMHIHMYSRVYMCVCASSYQANGFLISNVMKIPRFIKKVKNA